VARIERVGGQLSERRGIRFLWWCLGRPYRLRGGLNRNFHAGDGLDSTVVSVR
jgi:hypothetical protein